MQILDALTRRFHRSKYVRQLPFYLMRSFGVKKYYSKKEVESAIVRWKFNAHYAEFGYAVACHPDKLASDRLHDLRKQIAEKYGLPQDFSAFELIRLSHFKGNWYSGSSDNAEYWKLLALVEKKENEYQGNNR
ncbi:DUF6559 family protein [Hahella ganghwensis]|uniref:DUF6559 family protein n=1 Tax=Hahella ganghwensis TaxID=286420 RepID=UPI000372C8E1|nr:DUF6559 family protein [Hahella ganghwensis]